MVGGGWVDIGVRGYHVGGRSLPWGRQSYRMSNYDFKAASHDGYGDDWPISYADLAPYYDQVESFIGGSGSVDDRLRASGTEDTIPVERLSVRGEDDTPFQPLDPTRPVTVHSQDRSSSPGGDAVSNDYQVEIPFTASGEYQTELEYVVTAQ